MLAGSWPLTGISLMIKQKALIGLMVLVTAAAVVLLLRYQSAQHDPCVRQPRTELAERYPALAELLQRQSEESTRLLAEQRAQDFNINLEMSTDQVNLVDAMKISTQQIEAVAALRERHSQDFIALCRELESR
jgi:hypothetical protein